MSYQGGSGTWEIKMPLCGFPLPGHLLGYYRVLSVTKRPTYKVVCASLFIYMEIRAQSFLICSLVLSPEARLLEVCFCYGCPKDHKRHRIIRQEDYRVATELNMRG